MYWSENWDNFVRARREALENTAPTPKQSPARGGELLDRVIENSDGKAERRTGRPARVEFPTPAYEARFKSCLSRVPVDCRIELNGEKRAVLLRPKSIFAFDDVVRTNGLANCPATARIVRWLKSNPTEYIRFETH